MTDNIRWAEDLADYINVNDDLTGEGFLNIDRTKYYDFEDLSGISEQWNFKNNLTILSLNIRSLPNKVAKLANLLSQIGNIPTIINLQEIWSANGNLNLEGYSSLEFFSRESPGLPNPNCGGGVGIYIRKDLKYKKIA